jgi:hypothetical protein
MHLLECNGRRNICYGDIVLELVLLFTGATVVAIYEDFDKRRGEHYLMKMNGIILFVGR